MQNIVLSKKRWTNYQIIITTSYYCFNVKDDAIPLNSPTKVCRVPNTQYLVKEGNFGPRYIHIYIRPTNFVQQSHGCPDLPSIITENQLAVHVVPRLSHLIPPTTTSKKTSTMRGTKTKRKQKRAEPCCDRKTAPTFSLARVYYT